MSVINTAEAISSCRIKMPHAIIEAVDFCGQSTLEVQVSALKALLIELKELGFETLIDLSGVDYIDPEKKTRVFYWLAHPMNFERLRIVVSVERDGQVPSITDLWEGAAWYERELFDLFGVHFSGHEQLRRILMPDDWEGHPLRRDYALTEEAVEFKHGVKPKVPSKIIPYVQISKRS